MTDKPATLAGHEISMIETLLATYYPAAKGGKRQAIDGKEIVMPPDIDAAQLIAKLLALKLRYDERADEKADEWRGL